MKLYKYRSDENLEFILDIILNERLHCAPFDELNDPFEGIFLEIYNPGPIGAAPWPPTPIGSSTTLSAPRTISSLLIQKQTRICSLSASLEDVRLWSHYAGGHSGVAIEIEIDESAENLYQVEYLKRLRENSNGLLSVLNSTDILSTKTYHWSHEEEYRIITDDEFYSIPNRISGLYLGIRTKDVIKDMFMRLISTQVPIYSTQLNEQELRIRVMKKIS